MRLHSRSFCLLLALLLTLNTGYAEDIIDEPQTFRIAVDNWPPYQSRKAKHFGSIHRIITEAFALNNINVEYGWFPWARSLAYAKEGIWDGAALSQKTPERAKVFYFSDAIFSVEKVFFHRAEYNFNWSKVEDLKGLRIGGTLGYAYGPEFERADKDGILDVEWVVDNNRNFLKLLKKRIDVFPTEKVAGHYLLEKDFSIDKDKIVNHPRAIQSVSYHVIFSKLNDESIEMMEKFNLGLKQLRSNGRIQAYIRDGLEGKYLNP